MPVHLQPAYAGRVPLGPRGCRTTEALAGEIMSLPMFPELADDQVARVCAGLAALQRWATPAPGERRLLQSA